MLVIVASMTTMDSSVNKVGIIVNVEMSPRKVWLFLSDFNQTRIFATGFIHPVSHFTKILAVGADCSSGSKEGRTDRD